MVNFGTWIDPGPAPRYGEDDVVVDVRKSDKQDGIIITATHISITGTQKATNTFLSNTTLINASDPNYIVNYEVGALVNVLRKSLAYDREMAPIVDERVATIRAKKVRLKTNAEVRQERRDKARVVDTR